MKQEYPPLLEPGFHPMTLEVLNALCAEGFDLSKTRLNIMKELKKMVIELCTRKIRSKVWVDGSFLTKKIDPRDADLVVQLDAAQGPSYTDDQIALIDMLADNSDNVPQIDTHVFPEYPPNHKRFQDGERMRKYWSKWFGKSRSNTPKGIAIIATL